MYVITPMNAIFHNAVLTYTVARIHRYGSSSAVRCFLSFAVTRQRVGDLSLPRHAGVVYTPMISQRSTYVYSSACAHAPVRIE